MSKNFELLHSISNEKELFQTLDGWEDLGDADDATPSPEADRQKRETTSAQTGLPDVFQTVSQTLGPPGPLVSDPGQRPRRIEEPIERKDHSETPSKTFGNRFPISRNPITRLTSAVVMPAWALPKIGPGPEPSDEVAVEWKPEAFQSIAVPEAVPSTEGTRISSSNGATVEEPHTAKPQKTAHEPPLAQRVALPEPPSDTWAYESKSIGEGQGRKAQTRSACRDPRRELIAREEELKLVQRIFLGAEPDSPRIALFSGLEREGACAAICVRTAEIVASQGEGTVCLVDADFRSPSLHEYFRAQNEKGLAEATEESGPIVGFAQQLSLSNLWLVPSGYGAPHLNLAKAADRLRARMEELRHAYRYVIVHSGPLWLNRDAMMFGKWTDGVVLVLEANRTRRDTARRIKESLAVANAKVLGVVLNNRSYPIPESLYSRL